MGIEPTYAAWEAAVLPLNYTRIASRPFVTTRHQRTAVIAWPPRRLEALARLPQDG
jgi:hypothetical protein